MGAKRKAEEMWWRTYHRHQEPAYEAEQRSNAGFMVTARRLVKME